MSTDSPNATELNGDGIPDAANTAADTASGAPAAAAAAEAPASPAKARMFADDVRRNIVARHREHRQAQSDPSLSAARAESVRQAQAGGSNEGAGAAAVADGSVGVGGGQSPASSGDAGAQTVRVKVYGQEYDVPADVVEAAGGKAAYQKSAAADVLLRQAAEANARAQRAAQELEAKAKQATIPAAGAANADPGLPNGDTGDASTVLKDESRELLDAVLDSNPDRVAAALGKAVMKVKATAPAAAAAPASAPASPAVARSDLEIVTANAVFDTEFADVRANKPVMAVARDMMRARMSDPQYANVPLPEIARAIGRHLASTFPGASSGAPGDRSNIDATLELRERAKRQIPSARSAAQLSGAPAPSAPAPTREQKQQSFVQMLRARSGSNATIAERRATNSR